MTEHVSNPMEYFGQQVRKSRVAAGWTIKQFGTRVGYDAGQVSRIETGKRPPTETFAEMCDQAFPDRDGWFSDFYQQSRTWIATPPWFRSWVELEQHATSLRDWQPSILSGLLQTEDYARAILSVNPGVSGEQVAERVEARLARQSLLTRDEPPTLWFLVDEAALRRRVGSAEVMCAQLSRLAGLAQLPNITIQVVPDIAHAGLLGGFVIAEAAAFLETPVGGQVFEDHKTHATLLNRFDTIRTEALRGTESISLIERIRDNVWQLA
jgi:transcriptional regulator with XRE-family HTH domain